MAIIGKTTFTKTLGTKTASATDVLNARKSPLNGSYLST